MPSVGDVVSISGLTSARGIQLNGNYGKVTTPVNLGGRYDVTTFTEWFRPTRMVIYVPMGKFADALLEAANITVLPPDDPGSIT